MSAALDVLLRAIRQAQQKTTLRIIPGDCLQTLRTLSNESVQCVVTSPPYWGLRDYGVSGQLGMEPTYQEHVAAMVAVFREVRRVLKKDGTLWMNYGDTYASSVNGRSAADTKIAGIDDRTFRDKPFSTVQGVLKPKDLCGIPWRVAFALQEDGWWLRQDIIWHKPNPMPESIRDRCTKAHEYVFLLSKSERYFFDSKAMQEPAIGGARGSKFHTGKTGEHQLGRAQKERGPGNWGVANGVETRNRRSVWTIATKPFKEAHFATFPPELPEICIKAGTRPGDTVLDPFGGAGTTGLVAQRLGRNSILCELNPEYVDIAKRRVVGDTDAA